MVGIAPFCNFTPIRIGCQLILLREERSGDEKDRHRPMYGERKEVIVSDGNPQMPDDPSQLVFHTLKGG